MSAGDISSHESGIYDSGIYDSRTDDSTSTTPVNPTLAKGRQP
jgi:hypothetical protein